MHVHGDGGKSIEVSAAGGVVLRATGVMDYDVLVCGRISEHLWALPKGTPEAGESPLETALREVREETGLEVKAGPLVGEIRYSFVRERDGVRRDKTVRYFLMSPAGGDTSRHDAEFDSVEWVPLHVALERLTFENEARILEKAVALAKVERL